MIKMLKKIGNENFVFEEGHTYTSLDGDETDIEELKNKILVRQPNSPKKRNWWCTVDKSEIGRIIEVIG